MNLDPAPRLNKTYFVVTAAACFTAVVLIGLFAPDKFAPLPFLTAVGFLLVSIIAIMIPIIVDYGADSAEYVQAERGRVADQVQRLHAACESLARAAAQIKAVEEAVHKTAHTAENLPYRMQEKLAEFNETLAAKDSDDREALERELEELRAANTGNLRTVAEKIAKAATEWTALETANRKSLDAAHDASAKLTDRLQSALAQLDARIAGLNKAAASVPVAAPEPGGHRPPLQPGPTPRTAEPAVEAPAARAEPAEEFIESVAVTETPAVPASPAVGERAAEEPKPKKPRVPRKPKPEDTLAAMSADSGSTETADNTTEASANEEPAAVPDESPARAESSASSDGATRLLVTAYIGIGNKLFIRGDGPGLSWDKGAPMQFVSIGKWGWASHEATGPVKCRLYKNDDTAALSGEVTLEPGQHVEVSALF